MSTKKQLAAMPKPSSYSHPDISIKVRRSLARRSAMGGLRHGAYPVFFSRETSLSTSYNEQLPESYMQQIFTSVRKIGQGCFGDVFEVVSKEDLRMYAIKVTNDTHAVTDLTEVRRLEKIPEHKNCVKFYQAWQESNHLYIQMELCITSLDKVTMVYHRIQERQCWDILTDICEGLKHLHDHELIHLDIKPANVMVTAEGVCKLGDFGLLMDLRELNTETIKRRRTGMSVSEGDGKYVAVEVLQGNTYTKAGDIFSLGLMMLEIASDAALPSSGPGWNEIRAGILPECYYRRRLSQNYRQLINSMILRDHTQRPSVDDILQNPAVVKVLDEHKKGVRTNYMANWEQTWWYYTATHHEPAYDIPVVQILGPSPPRRSYPITYVHPRTPLRCPLNELGMNNETGPSTPHGGNRYARVQGVARQLFP